MAKKLKTGDVKRIQRTSFIDDGDKWVVLGGSLCAGGYICREIARIWKEKDERIARIISIDPKYVTVRISK